ncbi:hypothetical protein FJZ19_05365 [Candidatus Pacearchaeota archaeon]|nr:hypothetical protein [Candidatus Pacearchaeota archaeon]
MKILFVCAHNRFRSKVAEFIFKKLDKKDEVKSAGIQLDFSRPYVAENVKIALKKREIFEIDEKAREINIYDLEWADRIIIIADNINEEIFPREKTEIWKIGDADEKDMEKIEKIVSEIEEKVKKLIEGLH